MKDILAGILMFFYNLFWGKNSKEKSYQEKYVDSEKRATELESENESIQITNQIFGEEEKKQHEREEQKSKTSIKSRLGKLRNRFKRGSK